MLASEMTTASPRTSEPPPIFQQPFGPTRSYSDGSLPCAQRRRPVSAVRAKGTAHASLPCHRPKQRSPPPPVAPPACPRAPLARAHLMKVEPQLHVADSVVRLDRDGLKDALACSRGALRLRDARPRAATVGGRTPSRGAAAVRRHAFGSAPPPATAPRPLTIQHEVSLVLVVRVVRDGLNGRDVILGERHACAARTCGSGSSRHPSGAALPASRLTGPRRRRAPTFSSGPPPTPECRSRKKIS